MAKHKPRRKGRTTHPVLSSKALAGLEQASELIERGEMAEARQVLEALHRRYPGRIDVLNNLAYTCYQLGDRETYLQYCMQLCQLAPQQADYALSLASAYLLNERVVLGLRAYQDFLQRWPMHAQAEEVRAKVTQMEPDVRAMIAEIGLPAEAGLAAAAQHEEMQVMLAQGRYQQGYLLAHQLIEQLPEFAPAYNNLSQMLFLDNRPAEAIATAQKVLAFSPDNVQATANLVRFLLLTGRHEEASVLAEKLKAIQSDHPDAWVKKAEALSFLGDDAAVLDVFEGATQAGLLAKSSVPPLLYHLAAVAELRLGQEETARKYWQQAVQIAPGFELAVENLQDLHQPPGQRHGPWAYSFAYWLPRQTMETLVTQVKAAAKNRSTVTRVLRQFLDQHPDLEPLLPLLLQRSDAQAAEFIVMLASIAKTPYLLAALKDFALGQRGSDQLRMRAAQLAVEAGLLPAGEVRMWMKGEWSDLLLLSTEVSPEAVASSLPASAKRLLQKALQALYEDDGVAAEHLLLEALQIVPEEPSLLNNLISAYQLQGRAEEAEQLVQRLHELHPEYFFGRVQMAVLCIRRNDTDRAEALLRPLLQQRKLHTSEMVALCNAHILLLLKTNRREGARSWFGLLEQVAPEHPAVEALRPQVEGRL